MVQLPTSTHRLCWDREAAREEAPTPTMPLKTQVSSVLCGSQPCGGQHEHPQHCRWEEGTRDVGTSWLSSLLASCIWGSIFGRALS